MNETPDSSTPNAIELSTPQQQPGFSEQPPEGTAATPQLQEEPVEPPPAGETAAPSAQAPAFRPASGDAPAADAPAADAPAPAAAPVLHPAVHTHINAIEQLALFWGGETGSTIRNHLSHLRDLLSRL